MATKKFATLLLPLLIVLLTPTFISMVSGVKTCEEQGPCESLKKCEVHCKLKGYTMGAVCLLQESTGYNSCCCKTNPPGRHVSTPLKP
ncbi:unnamed protein product [Brassica rapa]|uniref:Knottin scorpion toxin-like domain-containing protein n=1 Tax=Brassica campestris TaxID=3711 RepID=A0A3P6BMX5_BRACM|nr:unnamed protein product [Brassica rapa]VDD02880.1 unnamed protein product [Brassica rapa]